MPPIVPPLFAFITGIIIRSYYPIGNVLALIAFLFVLALLYVYRSRCRWFVIVPFFLLGIIFTSGALQDQFTSSHITNFIDLVHGPMGTKVEGRIYDVESSPGDRSRLYIDADRVIFADKKIDVYGRILLTVDAPVVRVTPGDKIRFMSRLKRPRNFGNPGEFNYTGYLKKKGIYVTGFVNSEKWIVRLSEGGGWFRERITGIRSDIEGVIESGATDNAAVLKALFLGRKGEVPKSVREGFARTGIAHLLAISGLHIGIVTLIVYTLALWILRNSERCMLAFNIKKAATLLSIPPVLFYAVIAGFSLPTMRAVIMVIVFLVALILDRERDIYNTMAIAALVILLIAPTSILDASFQLSFAAILAIVFITPRLRMIFKREDTLETILMGKSVSLRIKEKISYILMVSIAAFLGTAPIVAYHFRLLPIVGSVANLVIVPLIGFLVVPLGLMAVSLIPLSHSLASILIWGADKVLGFSIWLNGIFAMIPFAAIRVARPTISEIVLIYLTILVSVFAITSKKMRLMLPIFLLPLLVIYGYRYYKTNYDPDLKITFISVGQGDAALVELPYGKRMLIDGGGFYNPMFDVGERIVAPILWDKGINKIDYMALSHPQMDHAGGLLYISKNFDIGEFWWNGDDGLTGLRESLQEKGVPMAIKDTAAKPMDINGVAVEFLHPGKDSLLDKNNRSLVIKLKYGDVSIIFSGDIEEEGERELLSRGLDLKTTILKIPHHGSRSSSTEEFVKALNPDIVVASVGYNNPFGFPHKEIIKKYRKKGALIYRTDKEGAITIETDGSDINVKGYLTDVW